MIKSNSLHQSLVDIDKFLSFDVYNQFECKPVLRSKKFKNSQLPIQIREKLKFVNDFNL